MTADAAEARVGATVDRLLEVHDPRAVSAAAFLGTQFDLGLAWVGNPEGRGGLGVAPSLQRIVEERLQAAGAPVPSDLNPIGYGMCGPTIAAHGTEEQCSRYLRPLFTGEEVWCQLFSEPGAGSDLAGLATRALRDGDEWVVDGQKVWTTIAHLSRWGLLLARTDPEQPKHKGLTAFLVDMTADGVEVRPLRQLTGDAEFNEVYFAGARVPDSSRLGDVGDGWRVGLTTLMNERVSLGGGANAPRGSGFIAEALRHWSPRGPGDAARRDRLVQLWIEAEVNRLTGIRAAHARREGAPGPEGSIGKLVSAEANKAILDLAVDLMGAEGMLYDSYEMRRPGLDEPLDLVTTQRLYLRARANSIEGGTSEIMRNIIGERVLGLPGDIRVDKDAPWTRVLRS